MKPCIILVFLLMTCRLAFSQLQIIETSNVKITYSDKNLVDFIRQNHCDYALIGSETADWQIFGTDDYYCLIQQNKNWYLAKISRTRVQMEPVKISVIQRQLSRVALDSVNRLLAADSAFKYTQADYDKLPPTCQFEKNGKMISFGVLDGSRFNLIQVSDKGVKSLSCYNADSFLRSCYPQVKEFGILKGFVNTVNQLSALTKDLKD